jgi:hypothetical protein
MFLRQIGQEKGEKKMVYYLGRMRRKEMGKIYKNSNGGSTVKYRQFKSLEQQQKIREEKGLDQGLSTRGLSMHVYCECTVL